MAKNKQSFWIDSIEGFAPRIWREPEFKKLGLERDRNKSWLAAINHFISLNQKAFDFLGIRLNTSTEYGTELRLERSNFCGAVTLYSAQGLPCATLISKGTYGEDVAELVSAIGADMSVEFNDKLPLYTDCPIVAPIYLECLKYIDLFIKAERSHWRKFAVTEKIENRTRAGTQWGKYAIKHIPSGDKQLLFPNRKNILDNQHREWLMLIGVLQYALDIISQPNTPVSVKMQQHSKLSWLHAFVQNNKKLHADVMRIAGGDPPIIKELKESANKIIQSRTSQRQSWRVDQAKLYEQFVQFILHRSAKQCGGSTQNNLKIQRTNSKHIAWSLAYLEPDITISLGDVTVIADAKYKSHMYNLNAEKVDTLKDDFRHDLHQVLAYSAFTRTTSKHTFLLYPCTSYQHYTQTFAFNSENSAITVHLIGIPFQVKEIENIAAEIASVLRGIPTKY